MYIIETKDFHKDEWIQCAIFSNELDAYTNSFKYDTPNNVVRVRYLL